MLPRSAPGLAGHQSALVWRYQRVCPEPRRIEGRWAQQNRHWIRFFACWHACFPQLRASILQWKADLFKDKKIKSLFIHVIRTYCPIFSLFIHVLRTCCHIFSLGSSLSLRSCKQINLAYMLFRSDYFSSDIVWFKQHFSMYSYVEIARISFHNILYFRTPSYMYVFWPGNVFIFNTDCPKKCFFFLNIDLFLTKMGQVMMISFLSDPDPKKTNMH